MTRQRASVQRRAWCLQSPRRAHTDDALNIDVVIYMTVINLQTS